ncbi:VIT domain-containing protein [uncultured Tenacibaculum sp.]|uniref:VIT domain-containing protein n=1 Tax=uncultured Tenacibaculum sp. TaxID=174713 RepID=UPI00263539BE|nr:VIT domain-containing protein [uncultured Tenacibaculum sp.]
MKKVLLISLLLFSFSVFTQKIPKITLKDSGELKLSSLKVNVSITGNFATTTYDMEFYNGLDRTLEGELVFPLGEGQSVYKFAMDFNGELREAVVIEKELARVAYETTVRQNIDPALLEKTSGNNYKARVYPILPKKNKRVVLTYEEELSTVNDKLVFELPIGIKELIEEFSLDVFISGITNKPTIKSEFSKYIHFIKKENGMSASLNEKNVIPRKPIKIEIKRNLKSEKTLTYLDYFYSLIPLKKESRNKQKPKRLSILWDTSFSMRNKDLNKEVKLLDMYFNYLQNIEVEFVSFSNAINKKEKFVITNGEWSNLKKEIQSLTYDGGTNLEILKTLKLKSDEILLFSDGLVNLGNIKEIKKKTIYTINSLQSANHFLLNKIATNQGGVYVNLGKLNSEEANRFLKQEVLQFLGVKSSANIEEVYPKDRVNVTGDFIISGRFKENPSIELKFGYQGKVSKIVTLNLKDSQKSNNVKRLWAKEKLKYLNNEKEENKKKIVSLAKQYHLITDYTSMLILDRIEDYVKYGIEPPKELRLRYKELLKEKEETQVLEEEDIKDRKEELFDQYEEIRDWYELTYPKKVRKKKIRMSQTSRVINTSTNEVNTTINTRTNDSHVDVPTTDIDYSKKVVKGIVSDSSGALPGATVIVKGNTRGVETDFDGNYTLNVEVGEVLVYSFVGYSTKEVVVNSNNVVNVKLEEDNVLEEVVVVAYGVKKESKSVSSSVIESLIGKSSGVKISQNNEEDANVSIKENNLLSQNDPMYIIDGIPVEKSFVEKLNSKEIETIEVIKPFNATKLYGAKARNGIIIYITKEGKEINEKEIDKLNSLIEERIELKAWNPKTPYLNVLKSEASVLSAYKKYLEIRDDYSNSPMFYIDVADFFNQKGEKEVAIRVLTNLIEIELDNYELIKALAYKLEYFKEYDLAKQIYKKVLELRPEEPQSYRDLALMYELTGDYQDSFNLLYKIYKGELLEKDIDKRFDGIETVVFVELTKLVSKYGNKLKLSKYQRKLFKSIPVDIRIVVDWNHNDTDLDLWVIDPNGEKAYYKNRETLIGGRMSIDMIEGYGPEEFMLKKAIKGKYKIMVNYYADNVQKISGPTILKLNVYKNYGRRNEEKQIVIVKLDKQEGDIEIGNLTF